MRYLDRHCKFSVHMQWHCNLSQHTSGPCAILFIGATHPAYHNRFPGPTMATVIYCSILRALGHSVSTAGNGTWA